MKDELAQVLAPVLGDDVVVENLRTLTGGASRITSAFDAVTRSGRRALILRAAPTADGQFASMELEAAVQAAAAEAGAPVPHILVASNSPAALGSRFSSAMRSPGRRSSAESSGNSTMRAAPGC